MVFENDNTTSLFSVHDYLPLPEVPVPPEPEPDVPDLEPDVPLGMGTTLYNALKN